MDGLVEKYEVIHGCTLVPNGYVACVKVICNSGDGRLIAGGAVGSSLGVFTDKDEAIRAAKALRVASVSRDGDFVYVMLANS